MRIAMLSSDWRPTGGVATYVRSVAAALAGAGHDVRVVHGEREAVADPPLPFGLSHVPGAFLREAAGERARVSAVLEILDEFAPDLVHVQSNNNFPLEAAVSARRPAVKSFHVHDYCPAGTKYHFGPDRACRVPTGIMCVPRMAYLRCTLSRRPNVIWSFYRHTTRANAHHRQYRQLIVCSNHVKQQAVLTGFDADRIAVVPYFTSLPSAVPPRAGRHVLALGRLVRSKGFDLLLDALRLVPGEWRAVMAGEGPERRALEARAAALGIAGRVTFSGWLTGQALSDAYGGAAVVAVPSRWPEPFGIVGLEAMAHGRPVVAFDVGGIPEWLEDGVGGSLIPAADVDALAARVTWLLDHGAEAAAIAARGRDRVAREFSAAAHLRRLLPVYERAVS